MTRTAVRQGADVLASAAAGDEIAFRCLIAMHHEDMCRVCAYVAGDLTIAEEATRPRPFLHPSGLVRRVACVRCLERYAGRHAEAAARPVRLVTMPRVRAYLTRIGIDEPVALDVDGLERLQRAHLTRVPFENLDVYAGREVRTDTDWSVPKIVDRGRGGWCYELNGAFAWLLGELGFRVKQLGATVLLSPDPMERGHLALEVTLERPYLVDVGFGDTFLRPLPLDDPGPHDGGSGSFRFEFGEETTLIFDGPSGPEPQYRFGSRAFDAGDFVAQSEHKRTDPHQHWRQKPFATRLLDGGPDRVTLLRDRLKLRRNGEWSETPVQPGDEWDRALRQWFDMLP